MEDKSSFELIVSTILFLLIWIVSTTETTLQSFTMSIILFLVSLVIFLRFTGLMLFGRVKHKTTVLTRNSDLLIFSFLGILIGLSSFYPKENIYVQLKEGLWFFAAIMMLTIVVRLAMVYRFTKEFETRTIKKEVEVMDIGSN